MAKKFITLNFRCGADYLNADWIYQYVVAYYIAKFNLKNCRHVSLSVGAFTTLLWKFAGTLYDVDFPALTTEELNLIKIFIANGAGIIYDESATVITLYPEEQKNEIRLNPIQEFPSLQVTKTFEDFINAACKRMTESYDPITGDAAPPAQNTLYGIDALHEYLMKVGTPPHEVQHRAIIRKQSLVNWMAAWLCGVERGEFGGPCPFGPNTLPQNLTEGETQNPEDTWLESYVNDFLETPFYWICGLQTFIPIKNLGDFDDSEPKTDSNLTNLDDVKYDNYGNRWCYPTLVERAQWLYDYLTGASAVVSPVAARRVGACITSKDCHCKKSDWHAALEDGGYELPHYEKFEIQFGTHSKPTTLSQAHLKASELGDDNGVYGAWKAEFEAWLDYIAANWMTDPDIVLFSDREAKDMVVQQYDGSVTVDDTRLQAIIDYLIDYQTNWQYLSNEWEVLEVSVTRPPDYVKITIDDEDEYYSLSEAYWHILTTLNDLANGVAIVHKDLEPVLGPCEPSICPETRVDSVDEDDSVYRVFKWWQHDQTPISSFSYQIILKQVPTLFKVSKTDIPVGPTYPDNTRQKNLNKVKALWTLKDDLGNDVDLNAAEILYLLAKALAYYYDSENQPETFEMLPSHVLPKGYFKFLRNGRFKLIFGPENQLNWLDLGQRWTLKPAVLQEAYR